MILMSHVGNFVEDGVALPIKLAVCPLCGGRGHHARNLGTFTGEEMDDLGDQFREDYVAGLLDSKCEQCDGLRVVEIVDEAALNQAQQAELKEATRFADAAQADYDSEHWLREAGG